MFSAREFVWWYNGHPAYRDLPIDLSRTRSVAIAGLGNVAGELLVMWFHGKRAENHGLPERRCTAAAACCAAVACCGAPPPTCSALRRPLRLQCTAPACSLAYRAVPRSPCPPAVQCTAPRAALLTTLLVTTLLLTNTFVLAMPACSGLRPRAAQAS